MAFRVQANHFSLPFFLALSECSVDISVQNTTPPATSQVKSGVEVYDAALHRLRRLPPSRLPLLRTPHQIAFYSRNWVTTQIEPIASLRGCFDTSSSYQDALYNVSDALWGPRKTEVQSGMSLRMGLDCYDLAGTIPAPPPYDPSTHKHIQGEKRLQYHTYWRTDLKTFGKSKSGWSRAGSRHRT
jgi:hypothetical protein